MQTTEVEGQLVTVPEGQWWMKTGNVAMKGDNEMQYEIGCLLLLQCRAQPCFSWYAQFKPQSFLIMHQGYVTH